MPKTTIEDLALMVQRGFADMNEQFQHVTEKVDRNTTAIDDLKGEARAASRRLDVVHEDISALTTLTANQSAAVSRAVRRLDDVQDRLTTLEERTA